MNMTREKLTSEIVTAMINNGFLLGDTDKQNEQVKAVCEAVTQIHAAISQLPGSLSVS